MDQEGYHRPGKNCGSDGPNKKQQLANTENSQWIPFEPGSKLVVLGMVIPPLIGNPYNGYINPYYWVDDYPLLYGNNGS